MRIPKKGAGEYHVRLELIRRTQELTMSYEKKLCEYYLKVIQPNEINGESIKFQLTGSDHQMDSDLYGFYPAALGRTYKDEETLDDGTPLIRDTQVLGREFRIIIGYSKKEWNRSQSEINKYELLCFLPKN